VKEDRTDAIFWALADATRRQVIRALSEEGPSTATGLAANLPVTRQAVTKHLATLTDAGLVTATRRGREKLYQLSPRPLTDAVSWMADLGARWDGRLAALREHVAARRESRGSRARRARE
jgi:DNA-binding transcriptional ArsR family regulator